MQSSAHLFNCARCRCQVAICSHCDQGNIYCGKRCSQAARRQSLREASKRYQKTRRGRFAHAERQRRYRQRRRHDGRVPGRGRQHPHQPRVQPRRRKDRRRHGQRLRRVSHSIAAAT